jgi:hypothetical protein
MSFKRVRKNLIKWLNSGRRHEEKYTDTEYVFSPVYYKSLGEKYAEPDAYMQLLQSVKRSDAYQCRQSIGNNILFSHSHESPEFRQLMGEPLYKCKQADIENLQMCFYKTEIGEMRVAADCHFYEDKLFMLHYFFPRVNNVTKTWLFNVLNDKYDLNLKNYNIAEIFIRDEQGNAIYVHNSSAISNTIGITYMDMQSPFWKEIEFHLLQQTEQNLNSMIVKEKDLYRKL